MREAPGGCETGPILTSRHLDALEAGQVTEAWLAELIARMPEIPAREVEYKAFERGDGSVTVFWHDNRPAGIAIALRDGLNCTQLTRIDLDAGLVRHGTTDGDGNMDLLRNATPDGRGKYALIDNRTGEIVESVPGSRDEFFVLKLKDVNAEAALRAYSASAAAHDPDYARAVAELADRAGPHHPDCKQPD